MIVKVCGMRESANMADVAAAGADWIGMIFTPESPRCVGMTPSHAGIIPDTIDTASSGTDIAGIRLAGVFTDAMPQEIITRTVTYGLDIIQLNGSETPTMMANLRKTVDPDIRRGIKMVKTISIGDKADIDRCRMYEDVTDFFLFDIRCTADGGSGIEACREAIDSYRGRIPFLLGGDIRPEDAARILTISNPLLAGVDLDTRFETAPAVKDAALVKAFISRLKGRR